MPHQDPTPNVADKIARSDRLTEYDDGLAAKDWLPIVESVTSHAPPAGMPPNQLAGFFQNATPRLAYVIQFPSRTMMTDHLRDISWDTEVWCADAPAHLIHCTGKPFLGLKERVEQ